MAERHPPDPQDLSCRPCGRRFGTVASYNQHRISTRCVAKRGDITFRCKSCGNVFYNNSSLQRHVRLYHRGAEPCFPCGLCSETFDGPADMESHRRQRHRTHGDFRVVESAHGRSAIRMRAFVPDHIHSVDLALVWAYGSIYDAITTLLAEFPIVKVNIYLHVDFVQYAEDGSLARTMTFPFTGVSVRLTRQLDFDRSLRRTLADLGAAVEEFLRCGSGWSTDRPVYFELCFARCKALTGGAACDLHLVRRVRGLGIRYENVGVNHDHGDCFFLALARGILGKDASLDELRMCVREAVRVPPGYMERIRGVGVPVADVSMLETLNPALGLKINVVYQDDAGLLIPMRASRNSLGHHEINLMLVYTRPSHGEDPTVGAVGHYCFVEDLQSLVSKRYFRSDGAVARTQRPFVCANCFSLKYTASSYQKHQDYCLKNKEQLIVMPKPGESISFDEERQAKSKSFLSAYILTFDFEALHQIPERTCSCPDDVLANTEAKEAAVKRFLALPRHRQEEICLEHEMVRAQSSQRYRDAVQARAVGFSRGDPHKVTLHRPETVGPLFDDTLKVCRHKSHVVANQPPFAYSMALIDRDGVVREKKTYVGLDAADNFVVTLVDLAEKYLPTLSPGVPMRELTRAERRLVADATHCYLCAGILGEETGVLDHDHLNGAFLGVAHNLCNLRRRESVTLTAFAHNFSGYDSHFLVRSLVKFKRNGRIADLTAIPLNRQRFKSLTVNRRIQLLDSAAFFAGSLESCVDILKKSGSAFPIFSQCTPTVQMDLLTRKGIYPYSFATSIQALEEATDFPPIQAFYNDLTEEACSEEDYEFAKECYRRTGCTSMLDYSVLYVSTDTLLLADVMVDFRRKIFDLFGLDLARYLSLPHLAFDAMLKCSGVSIGHIHDHEMSDLLKKGIRGGFTFVNTRLALAEGGEEGRDKSSLLFLDANNLYGKSMTYPMPVGDYEWMEEGGDELKSAVDKCLRGGPFDDDDEVGHILEVDLGYPEELHRLHDAFTLAPENITITADDLSPYSARCNDHFHHRKGARHNSAKLSATFNDRRQYLVHERNLAFYVRHGLKIKKVRRGIKFRQSLFLQRYIQLCTEMRQRATTELERSIWKAFANTVYGKFIESVENRFDVRFSNHEATFVNNATSPLFEGTLIVDQDTTLSFMRKATVKMRQCWAIGFTVLELSKLVMAEHFYDVIQPRFGPDNVSVVLSDTDSFLLHVLDHTDDEAMAKLADVMDTSNLPDSHPLKSQANARVPGKLKNEFPHTRIRAVAAVKPKSYIVCTHDGPCHTGCACKRTAKGVRKSASLRLDFSDYLRVITGIDTCTVTMPQLRAVNHRNMLMRVDKVAFSSLSDKRYQLCPIHSVPYGSVLIKDYLVKFHGVAQAPPEAWDVSEVQCPPPPSITCCPKCEEAIDRALERLPFEDREAAWADMHHQLFRVGGDADAANARLKEFLKLRRLSGNRPRPRR